MCTTNKKSTFLLLSPVTNRQTLPSEPRSTKLPPTTQPANKKSRAEEEVANHTPPQQPDRLRQIRHSRRPRFPPFRQRTNARHQEQTEGRVSLARIPCVPQPSTFILISNRNRPIDKKNRKPSQTDSPFSNEIDTALSPPPSKPATPTTTTRRRSPGLRREKLPLAPLGLRLLRLLRGRGVPVPSVTVRRRMDMPRTERTLFLSRPRKRLGRRRRRRALLRSPLLRVE